MKIKVLHITKMRGVSGSENHLRALLEELDQRRFEIHLCILAEKEHLPLLDEYREALSGAGVVVSSMLIRKPFDLSVVFRLRAYFLQEHFQIIHTHLIHADFYGTLAAKLAGVPIIISSKHNDDRFRRYKVMIWLNRLLTHWHTKVIVISDWIGKFHREIEGLPAEKIVRIHYGLRPESLLSDRADTPSVRQQFHIPEHAPLVGTIGRLTLQKGHRYLLHAVKQIQPDFPELRVMIVGNGELECELAELAKELHLEKNIIFTGYRSDAKELLADFDFFVFPSLWEGFGLVLLEAMALKKAVVASNVSAIPESVQDGITGSLVPPRDADSLAEAMLSLLRDKELTERMGEAGYQYLQQHFTIEAMVKSTERLYVEAIADTSA